MKKPWYKNLIYVLAVLYTVAPLGVNAAGFVKDALFLSRSPVTEGQTVHIYATINNSDTTAFTGTLMFYDSSVRIGSNNINLAAGGAQTVSILWTPSAGTHQVEAQLVSKNGTVTEKISQEFTIAENPQASSPSLSIATTYPIATVDSSAAIQKDIAGISPQVASASEPLFTVVDSARNNIANVLDNQIATTKLKVAVTPKPGVVAGVSTESTLSDAQLQNPTTGFWYWLYTAYLWALLALRWLVGNAGVFYPVLAIAFLYLLYRMYRRFRRPAWEK